MKKIMSIMVLVLALVLVLPMLSGKVHAYDSGDAVISGACGSGVYYALDSYGRLEIWGDGYMYSFGYSNHAPWRDYDVDEVFIDDGVMNVGDYAFDCQDSISFVFIGDSVETIGERAFYCCDQITSVYISENCTYIDDMAFYGCSKLDYLTLPDELEIIGDRVFGNCSMVKSVVIPESVTKLGDSFYGSGLKKIVFKGDMPEMDPYQFTYGVKAYYDPTASGWDDIEEVNDYGTVEWIALEPPKITKQPTSITVDEGKTATVSVKVQDPDDASYRWYYKDPGDTSFKGSSVYKASYSVKMDMSRKGRKVYCVITNSMGQETKSKTVTLGMRALAKITKQPVSVTVKKGTDAKVTVKATGDGLKYTWYACNAGASTYTKSTVTTSSYSVKMDASRSGRKVYCVVTDKYGNKVKSDVVTLKMAKDLKITKQPASVAAANGKTATVSFKVTGTGLKYTWYVKDVGQDKYTKSSVTTATYSATMGQARHGRKVYCVIKDYSGKTVKTDTVVMRCSTLKVTKQPVDVYAKKGETAKVSVKAMGVGLKYRWYIKNAGAPSFVKSSVTTASYSLTMDSSRSGRQVYCLITDSKGNSVKSEVVTLKMAKTLKVTQQPTSVTVANGKTAKVVVKASGTELKYQWYTCEVNSSKFTKSSVTGSSYSVSMSASRHGRKVYCVITDYAGNKVKTKTVTLSSSTFQIARHPVSVQVAEGKYATFKVVASGSGLKYKWYISNDGVKFTESSNHTSTYSVPMKDSCNGRQAYCVVTNSAGKTKKSHTVTMTMINEVKITSQPKSTGNYNGYYTYVSVGATGDGLTYTWYYRDGSSGSYTKASSTGSSYSVSMSSSISGRSVYCVVKDKYGNSVKTNVVTLTSWGNKVTTDQLVGTWYLNAIRDASTGNFTWTSSWGWKMYVYSDGTAVIYAGSDTFRYNWSYSYSSGSYRYYNFAGSTLQLDTVDDIVLLMIDGDGWFFEN